MTSVNTVKGEEERMMMMMITEGIQEIVIKTHLWISIDCIPNLLHKIFSKVASNNLLSRNLLLFERFFPPTQRETRACRINKNPVWSAFITKQKRSFARPIRAIIFNSIFALAAVEIRIQKFL